MGGMTGGEQISAHLAACIEARMEELGLSPTDLAEASGLTLQALGNVRKGLRRKYQRRLTGPLTKALGWSSDSIRLALDGEQPRVVATPLPPRRREPADPKIAELDRRLTAVEAEGIGLGDDLTTRAEEAGALIARALRRLDAVEARLARLDGGADVTAGE